MKNLFILLRTKIERRPDRNFDQRFWARFEAEFGEPRQASAWSRIFNFKMSVFATASVAALTLAVILLSPGRILVPGGPGRELDPSKSEDLAIAASFAKDRGFWEDFELFETMDDLALSDQDWDELLAPSGPGDSTEGATS